MSGLDLQDELAGRRVLAPKLACAGAAAAGEWFRRQGLVVTDKARGEEHDPVSQADRNSERVMREMLFEHFPEDEVKGEEFSCKEGESGWCWHLDPVDGTRSFIAGVPVWTTLVGLAFCEEMRFGCVVQPLLQEMYQGDGCTAYFSVGDSMESSLSVSGCRCLDEARFATTDPGLFLDTEQAAYEGLVSRIRQSRFGLDAYAYARLAAGTIDLVAESGLQAHDVAALIPIVTGAGGVITDWRGNGPELGGRIVAASNRVLLDQALSYLSVVAD